MKLKIEVEIDEVGTSGLWLGDAIEAIQKALEPVKQRGWREDEPLDEFPVRGGDIVEPQRNIKFGFWKLVDGKEAK